MDGVLIINKPKGITSQGVVSKVKKILNEKKVGHAGTLDPNATGVLPILVGKGTKVSKYLMEHNKKYRATIKFGKKTTTGDSEGEILEEMAFDFKKYSEKDIQDILNKFIGISTQTPPMYSAIKVNGKKLYEYAREGVEVERKPREIEIYSIMLEDINYKDSEITYNVECSKGTYIRTLCEDIAVALGTIGYMKELTRTKVNNFTIETSITLEELSNLNKNEISDRLLKLEELFYNNEKVILDKKKEKAFINGVKLSIKKEDGLVLVYNDDKIFIGLGIIQQGLLRRDIVL